jgi:multidrug efflux pump subunit AcrB
VSSNSSSLWPFWSCLIVSLLSLGWRVGIVVAAAVPITFSATLVIMLSTGKDLDRITLGALILSLGLLVDDAIISIETMVVKMEEGWDRIKAAGYAWSHTAAPMLAGTLVTIIGLMPVGFAQSSAGEYCRNLFWVVCIALLTSWVVAVIRLVRQSAKRKSTFVVLSPRELRILLEGLKIRGRSLFFITASTGIGQASCLL